MSSRAHVPVLNALAEMGCDIAQGFLVSTPMRGLEVTHWLYEQATPLSAWVT